MKRLILVILTAGIAGYAGYKVGYSKSKKKYVNLADTEVESVKKRLEKYYENKVSKPSVEKKEEPKKEVTQRVNQPLDRTVKPTEKTDYSKQYKTDSSRIVGNPETPQSLKKEKVNKDKVIITPEEFSESEFETATLIYFADGVLTDDDWNVVTPEIIGGYSNLDQIGLYESDILHVRDSKLGVDYEIIMDERQSTKVVANIIPDPED